MRLTDAAWVTSIGLALGNFAYQATVGGDWSVATERSFFQSVAVVAMWWLVRRKAP